MRLWLILISTSWREAQTSKIPHNRDLKSVLLKLKPLLYSLIHVEVSNTSVQDQLVVNSRLPTESSWIRTSTLVLPPRWITTINAPTLSLEPNVPVIKLSQCPAEVVRGRAFSFLPSTASLGSCSNDPPLSSGCMSNLG